MALRKSQYREHLHHNLEVLVNNGRIGSSILQPANIQTKPNKLNQNYHYYVEIPYAGQILNWEVIFDPEDLFEVPDFDFNDFSFLPNPDINYIAENIPSWDAWDLTNHQSMLNILNEFLALYKKAQMEKFKQNKFSNIESQYEELLKQCELAFENVEIQIEDKPEFSSDSFNEDPFLINILIILPIDFSQLPEYLLVDSKGENDAHIQIQMKKPDNSQTKVSLNMSSGTEKLLGKVKLPKFSKESTLAEYVEAFQTNIENQIKLIKEQHEARNRYICSVIDAFPTGILEYDATGFYKISFIYEELEDYDCLVSIVLGGKFPHERPKVQLHSLYCQAGKKCNTSVSFYLYNSQATEEENMKNLRDTLFSEVKQFHKHKH